MSTPSFFAYMAASEGTEEVLGQLDPSRIRLQPAEAVPGPALDPMITHLIYYGDTYLTFCMEGDTILEFWVAGTEADGYWVYWYTIDPQDGPTIGRAATSLDFTREEAMAFLAPVVH